MPFGPITVLAALLHLYIGLRLVPAVGPAWPWGAALALLLVASTLLMPLAFVGRRGKGRRAHEAVAWLGLLCMGLFSSLFVLTLVRDAVLLLAWAASFAVVLPWPALVERSAQAVPLAALLITVLGFVNARRTARVVRVDVPIRDLAPALQGFLIAQISDLHVGPTIRGPYLRRIVERVNALDADVVAVTGDLVDGSVPELAAHIAPLGDLRARHGSYVVTGNHEYYAGAAPWIRELRRLGLSVLLNEHVVLRSGGAGEGGASLALAGVTDFSAGHFDEAQRSDPAAAIAGAPDDARVRVLLAHQPRSAFAAVEAGYDLQLSGHTHGGQFWPWGLFVRFQQPFTAGLHKLRDMWVYTSRGTGYWGPPKRFGAPSEITLLRLVRAAA